MTEVPERPATSRIRRVHALINPASGGVGPAMAGEVSSVLAEFGLDHQVSELEPGRFQTIVRAAIDAEPDLMLVFGGDGTTRMVAETSGPRGPFVAPLSGGTMNKLSRAMYGTRPWREVLAEILTRGTEQWAPGGDVEGRPFFCSAVLGAPALVARAREAVRARRFRLAWSQVSVACRRVFQSRLRYSFDEKTFGRGRAIGLICPTISRALSDAVALEVAVLDLSDFAAGARLALNHLTGDWRDDPDVMVLTCLSGRISARHAIPAMLDGELFRFGREVEIRFLPHAFRTLALRPKQETAP